MKYIVAFLAVLTIFCLPFVICNKNPVIFNFGDSNSDTGGYAAALGLEVEYPYGRAFFHQPNGRVCDGRLVIDFLCENLNTNYLSPYLDSLNPDFKNGVNFAISGAATLPRHAHFNLNLNLDVQVLQFRRFQRYKGFTNLVGEMDFKNALYMIDIGQNDLSVAFNSLSYAQVIEKIPSFISEIKDAMWAIYGLGGKNFWVHNTGPLGCLPQQLATIKTNPINYDKSGCIKSLNEGAKAFNAQLKALCEELRSEMEDSIIVYVDVYSIKYDLIANAASYGFNNPLMTCCGYGGPPYNYNPNITCLDKDCNACDLQGPPYINWDGIHYTEAANAFVASKILSTNYSSPSVPFNFFWSDNAIALEYCEIKLENASSHRN